MGEIPRGLTFGRHADAYERARPPWPEAAARWLVPAGARLVVEVGAGTGKLTRALAATGARVLAVEPDARMLAVLAGLGLEGVEGSAEALPVEDGAADAVVAGSSLHWFDLAAALAEFRRALAPGGRLGFGWNHRDTSDDAITRMSEAIYAVSHVRGSWRGRDWTAAVSAGGRFRDVEHERFPYVFELPREALRDHLLSYSGIASLTAGERGALLAEVAEIVEPLARGDRLRLPFVADVYRAVRA